MENEELRLIKKLYGEEMMHLCRTLFPTVLNTPFMLLNILENHFVPTHSLISDIEKNHLEEEFKIFVLSFINERKNYVDTDETPFALMEKAGYKLYECKNEDDIQSFSKYYREDEIICTITKKNRLKRCYVFFAVKNNVDMIKREDFSNPERDDIYGTSVISIQFDRGKLNTISIKNRYNHTIKYQNPDCTFDNNLENIIPGLTKSFEKYYGLNIMHHVEDINFVSELPYTESDNKYYRYNCEFDHIYYCENNYIIDHGILIDKFARNRERYILMDYYVLDRKEKKVFLYDEFIEDSFIDSINSLGKINDIIVTKNGEEKIIKIIYENNKNCEIRLNSKNRIISYKNNYVETIYDNFMYYYNDLKYLELGNVSKICYNFLTMTHNLENLELPKVKEIGDNFMMMISNLKEIFMPEVIKIGNNFLRNNHELENIFAPKLEQVGDMFLTSNTKLRELDFSNFLKTGSDFITRNRQIEKISIPRNCLFGENSLSNFDFDNYFDSKGNTK